MLPTIRKGDSNLYVAAAQCLTEYEPADGEFTVYYETHVKDWQSKHGLTADGIIGAGTWKAIAQNAPTVSTKTLRYGAYAKAVQLLLKVDLFPNLEVDGIYGNKTKEAVEAYQKQHGLTADGITGQKTYPNILMDYTQLLN